MTIKQQGGVFGRNPTFSTVTLDGGNGFGTGDLNVAGFSNFNGRVTVTDDHFRVVRSANTSRLEVGVDATSAYLKPSYSSGGTRDLRFLSINTEIARITANGLTFNGDTAAANALNDYEEGTWTPVIADAATGGNTGTAGDLAGFYTKVGRLVTVLVRIVNTDTVGMTPGNTLYVRGLPFAATATGNGHLYTGSVRTADVTLTGHTLVAEIGASGADYIRFSESQSGSAATFLTVGDLTLYQSDIFFSLTYAV